MANLNDARLRELQRLARIHRTGSLDLPSTQDLDNRDRSVLADLIYNRRVNPTFKSAPC